MRILIAIPAFNEEQTIAEVLRALPAELPGAGSPQALVVDDGSGDRTSEAAEQEGAVVIRHDKNKGVGKAFQTAVEQALRLGADVMVTIDADAQFDPGQIPELLAPILQGEADFVTGTRFSSNVAPRNMPATKYWGNLFVAGIIRLLTGLRLSDVSCGFRAYSREALYHLNLFGRFTYTQETILDLAFKGMRVREIPVTVRYDKHRESRVARSVLRYGINAGKIITRTVRDFSPLRFFGTIGLAVFLIGGLLDLGLAWHFYVTGSFSPYKAVGFVGGALNIAGLLLAGLGLLADMLGRIRINQERLLYHHKKHLFEEHSGRP